MRNKIKMIILMAITIITLSSCCTTPNNDFMDYSYHPNNNFVRYVSRGEHHIYIK